MEEFYEDGDFSDLYADVEVQVSSTINAIQPLSQLAVEDKEAYGCSNENGNFQDASEGDGGVYAEEGEEKGKEGDEGQEEGTESESESESEDDFDIVLNDDGDNENGNGNGMGGRDGFLSGGNGGRVGNDNDEENEVESGGSNGGERSNEGKGGCSGGSSNSQDKYLRYSSTTFSSKLSSYGSAGVASYLSTLVRGDWEGGSCTHQFRKSLIGSQSVPNFSLPHSRTILDINVDALEQKPWRNTGADITDFFNFGFDEDSWKSYCNQLDYHRKQTMKVIGSPAYQHARHSKVRLSDQSASASNFMQHLKGRTIQVEDGLSERQPSVNTRLPVDRDSDVVIEIPLQDFEEDHLNLDTAPFNETTSYLTEGSGCRGAGLDDAADMLYFSGSEEELPMLEGPTGETRKSNSHRHTCTGDIDPSCLDSDSHGNHHVSDANELHHQVTKCVYLDGLSEEVKAFDEPEKSDGTSKTARTSENTPESSQSEQNQCIQSSSPFQNDYVGSKDGAYAAPDNKFHDHSEMASPNLASELCESITFDHHSTKDSRKSGVSMRSGDYNFVARCRSPVQRNMKFQQRRSSRVSGLKKHLDDEYASRVSIAEDLHDAGCPAVGCHRQRKRNNDLGSYGEKNCLYDEELELSLNYRRARFPSKAGRAFARYPYGKDNQGAASGYRGDKYHGRHVKCKLHFPEPRTPRLSNEVVEQEWDYYRKGICVQEIDCSNNALLRQSIDERAPHLDNVNNIRSKRSGDEFQFKRRMEINDFSAEYNHINAFTHQKYRHMPYDGRAKVYIQNNHGVELPYGEANSSLKKSRRYGDLIHDYEDIWRTDCDDERSRHAKNQLSFPSFREPEIACRGWWRATSFSRNGMFARNGKQRGQNCVERYRGSERLDGYADVYINDYERMNDHDNFLLRRRQYRQYELLHSSEQKNYRHQEDITKARVASHPFGRTSSYKRFYSKPDSGHGKRLIDGMEPNKNNYKLPIKGDRCSQFEQSSNSVHRENLRQAPPSCWASADSQIVGGDGESSRCSNARCVINLDWKHGLEPGSASVSDGSHFEKVILGDCSKNDSFQNDANWSKKLSDSLQNDSLDVEEGQIVTGYLNKKPRCKASASEDARKFISVQNISSESAMHQNTNAEELENSRIEEILAKMAKRRERFRQPIALKNAPEKNSNPLPYSNPEAKVQRPARKRKWVGS